MNLTQGLHRSVQQHPDGIATVYAGRMRTHAESVDRIARLAAGLTNCGVEDGERAAILSLNSDRYHEFLAATLWAGGVVVPVNLRWSIAEIAESLSEVDARVLVVDDAFAGHVPGIRAAHPRLEYVIHAGDGPRPAHALDFERLIADNEPMDDVRRGGRRAGRRLLHRRHHRPLQGRHAQPRQPADLGARRPRQRALAHPGGTYLHAAPMFHLADLAAWTSQLVRGGTHVMIPMFEPVAVMTAIAEQGITDVLLVPTMIQLPVDHPRIDEFDLPASGGSSTARRRCPRACSTGRSRPCPTRRSPRPTA